jgi:hypothetical protein
LIGEKERGGGAEGEREPEVLEEGQFERRVSRRGAKDSLRRGDQKLTGYKVPWQPPPCGIQKSN